MEKTAPVASVASIALRPLAVGLFGLAALGLIGGCGSSTGPVSQASNIVPTDAPDTDATTSPDVTPSADSDATVAPAASPEAEPTLIPPSSDPVVGTERRTGAAAIDPSTIQVAASSQLASTANFTYGPRNTLDDNLLTAWNHDSQNNVIAGGGQQLTYQFATPVRIDRIEIVNGYAQDESAFAQNARVERLVIVPDSGSDDITWTLTDTDQLQSIDDLGLTNVSTIELLVQTVYPGSDYLDTAITDVYFFHYGPAGS